MSTRQIPSALDDGERQTEKRREPSGEPACAVARVVYCQEKGAHFFGFVRLKEAVLLVKGKRNACLAERRSNRPALARRTGQHENIAESQNAAIELPLAGRICNREDFAADALPERGQGTIGRLAKAH